MNELPAEVRVALLAIHRVLVHFRWMVGEQARPESWYDILDRLEILPTRILDGEMKTFFAEIEDLAKAYPEFQAAWHEAHQSAASLVLG